jgi:hypothetical protein
VSHLAYFNGAIKVSLLGVDYGALLDALLPKLGTTKAASIVVHCSSPEHARATLIALAPYLASQLPLPDPAIKGGDLNAEYALTGGHFLVVAVAAEAFASSPHSGLAAAVVVVAGGYLDSRTQPEQRAPLLRRACAHLAPGGLCLAAARLKAALPYLDHLLAAASPEVAAAGALPPDLNSNSAASRKLANVEKSENEVSSVDFDNELELVQRCWHAGFAHAEVLLRSFTGDGVVAALKGPLPGVYLAATAEPGAEAASPRDAGRGSNSVGSSASGSNSSNGSGQKKGKSTRPPVAPPLPLGPSAALALFDVNPAYLSDGSLNASFGLADCRRLRER